MRAYPDPDPMLRYISDEEAPAAFWQMPPNLRSERAVVGKRSREWTAVCPKQIGVVREMARCLREIGVGRVPR